MVRRRRQTLAAAYSASGKRTAPPTAIQIAPSKPSRAIRMNYGSQPTLRLRFGSGVGVGVGTGVGVGVGDAPGGGFHVILIMSTCHTVIPREMPSSSSADMFGYFSCV